MLHSSPVKLFWNTVLFYLPFCVSKYIIDIIVFAHGIFFNPVYKNYKLSGDRPIFPLSALSPKRIKKKKKHVEVMYMTGFILFYPPNQLARFMPAVVNLSWTLRGC